MMRMSPGQQEQELKATLERGSRPELRSVICRVSGKQIILSGQVSSFYLKQVAQSLILDRVRHTLMLENRLEVSRPAETVPTWSG
jgi:hypothetical protein